MPDLDDVQGISVQVGGIILCGGRSSRMGLPKALLPFGPESMLERVVRLLRAVVRPLIVVAAEAQSLPELPPEIMIARDQRPERGPLEAIWAGLTALAPHAEAAYITGCDVPLLVPAFVQKLRDLLLDHDAVVPVQGDFCQPLAAIYRARVLPHVARLLAADRLRPLYLLEQIQTRRVPVEELRDVDPELHTLENLNYPQDYLAALRSVGLRPPAHLLEQLLR